MSEEIGKTCFLYVGKRVVWVIICAVSSVAHDEAEFMVSLEEQTRRRAVNLMATNSL